MTGDVDAAVRQDVIHIVIPCIANRQGEGAFRPILLGHCPVIIGDVGGAGSLMDGQDESGTVKAIGSQVLCRSLSHVSTQPKIAQVGAQVGHGIFVHGILPGIDHLPCGGCVAVGDAPLQLPVKDGVPFPIGKGNVVHPCLV